MHSTQSYITLDKQEINIVNIFVLFLPTVHPTSSFIKSTYKQLIPK